MFSKFLITSFDWITCNDASNVLFEQKTYIENHLFLSENALFQQEMSFKMFTNSIVYLDTRNVVDAVKEWRAVAKKVALQNIDNIKIQVSLSPTDSIYSDCYRAIAHVRNDRPSQEYFLNMIPHSERRRPYK